MKKNKQKKKRKIYKSTILFIVLDVLVAICFFITYGPYDKLRNLYVTTAMKTMNHQYLAKIFYSDEQIQAIMDSNYFVTIDDNSDVDNLIIDTKEKESYENEYQKELMTRDPGNDLYKIEFTSCNKDNLLFKCNPLHIHHNYYIFGYKPWEYENNALVTLCASCHQKRHQNNKVPLFSEKKEILTTNLPVCDRCYGSGYLPEYHYHLNGICFKCNGEGVCINK